VPPVSEQPAVSVALCTHNGARFVAEQVDSILVQSYPVTEIVLSDDASSDDTVSIVRRVVGDHNSAGRNPVQLVVLQNATALGVVKNFEQAITATTGELVALCDQDDVWLPGRVGRLVREFADRPDLVLVHSNAALIEEDGARTGYSLFEALEVTEATKRAINSGRAFRELLHRNVVTGATAMIVRPLATVAAPFPQLWVHDEWLAMIGAATADIGLVDEQLTLYRQHTANQIGARKLSLREKIQKLREPRDERNRNLGARATVLLERLIELSDEVPPAAIFDAQAYLKHQAFRRALPKARWRRVVPVLLHGAIHDYSRYGRGRIDMVRDLTQPVDPTGAVST
jgi:glycosyltransferase involved in cell wall biosynthesis